MIDIGCGPNKAPGYVGIDRISFPGVDIVCDAGNDEWPITDGCVIKAKSSHFLEHLTAVERVHFCNELYRVLAPGGTCELVVPHWSSCRAYGDPTHQWPPVSDFWFYYLDRDWRKANAPHTDIENWDKGYSCHLGAEWAYSMNPVWATRSLETQTFAMGNYREAVMDIIATLTKKA